MKILLDVKNIALLATAILNFILGLLIYFNGRHKKINKIYAWNILAIIGWVLAMFFYRSSAEQYNIFWCTLLYIVPTIIASSFLYFTYIFPYQSKEKLYWQKVIIFGINTLLIIAIATPGFIIKQVNLRPGLEKEIIFNSAYWFYFLYILIYFSFGFWRLLKKYLKSHGEEKSKIIYLLIGYALAANLAFITNLIMPWLGNFYLNWLGQIFTVSMVAFTAYAIVVHRLMDIKLILRRSFAYLSPVVTIIILATLIEYLIAHFYVSISIQTEIDFAILILSLIFFLPLKNFYYRLANKYFFTSLYDSQTIIANLTNNLRTSLNVEKICALICKILTDSFHSKSAGILIYDDKKDNYRVAYNSGFNTKDKNIFANDKLLQNNFAKKNKTIIVEEIKKSSLYKKSKNTIDLFDNLGIKILAPLNIKNKTIGLIVLGIKESKDSYNDEDLGVLQIVGAQAAIALQNALLYQESLAFGKKLKKEIDHATKQLREANSHLKELDKAKTEFVSITSHQLRTPLSGIKGYLSMLLEGDFGQLNKQQKDIMDNTLKNTERLIRLVNIFLNISRIESGRLKLLKSEFNLIELIDQVVDELKNEAKNKNLELKYIAKIKKLNIYADRDKLQDVILNLTDNAIKYTPQGSVKIDLQKTAKGWLRLIVKDTGVGVSSSEAKKLFTKFARGSKISEINTSGSGLGLFIAKRIIELHKGKIWIESKGEGKGSQFIFEIPIGERK